MASRLSFVPVGECSLLCCDALTDVCSAWREQSSSGEGRVRSPLIWLVGSYNFAVSLPVTPELQTTDKRQSPVEKFRSQNLRQELVQYQSNRLFWFGPCVAAVNFRVA